MAKYLCIAQDKYGNVIGQDEVTAQGVSDAEIQFNVFSSINTDDAVSLTVYKLEKVFDYSKEIDNVTR